MDHKLQAIQEYLTTLEYAKDISKDLAYYIKNQSKHYFLQDDKLYCQGSLANSDQPRLVLLKQEHQVGAMWAYHSHPLGGHFAYNTTLQKISARYYWPGMAQEVKEFVQRSDRCQRIGKPELSERLNPIPVTHEPFRKMGIDVRHVKTSRGCHRYIVADICYLTKWVEAKPLRVQNACEVSLFICNNIIVTHGTPEILISDNGSSFVNKIVSAVCKRFGIKHKTTSPYHPEGNGLIERLNRTLVQVLQRRPDVEKQDWHLYLPATLNAYRTMRHHTTKKTPFLLTYGREAFSPSFDRTLIQDFEKLSVTEVTTGDIEPPSESELQEEKLQALIDFQITQLQAIRIEAANAIFESQKVQRKAIENKILKKRKLLKPAFQLGDHVELYRSYLETSWCE